MGHLEKALHRLFIEKQWTLSLAESCSGGELAAGLTKIPDCSLYFLGSVVAYSNSAKQKLLGVSPQTLERHGAVSEETAREMAQGALEAFGSDYALSVTGIAGPGGGSEEKPVGRVCFAVAKRGEEPMCWTKLFKGARQEIIEQTVQEGLRQLISHVQNVT